jgi:glutamate carboxypeptidase
VSAPVSEGVLRLAEWLDEREAQMVRLASELARLESPTLEPETQGGVFDLIGQRLAASGYRVRRLRGRTSGGQLVARPAHRQRHQPLQLLIGHVDTVWPVGTLDHMPVMERDGKLYGPGVFDMKGGLAQALFTLSGMAELGLEPTVTPIVFLNSDEEIGSGDSERWIRRLGRRVERTFVLEPALEPAGKLKTSRRGGGHFELVVRGRSAHTGLAPGEGASAIHELSHLIPELYGLSDLKRGVTVNVGEIRGGTRPNMVAAEASAVIDVRVRTRADGRRIEEAIRGLEKRARVTPGTSVEVRGGVDRAPMEPTPRNRVLWEAALEVGRVLGIDLDEGMSGGGSDGNTTSLYTATLDGLGAVGDGAHAVHEHLDVARMPERAALLGGLLMLPRLSPGQEIPEGGTGSRQTALRGSEGR